MCEEPPQKSSQNIPIKLMHMSRTFPEYRCTCWIFPRISVHKSELPRKIDAHVLNLPRKSLDMLELPPKIDAHAGTFPEHRCTCWNFPKKSMHMLELSQKIDAHAGTFPKNRCTYQELHPKIDAPVKNFTPKSMHLSRTSPKNRCTCQELHPKIDALFGTSKKNRCTFWNFKKKSMHILELQKKIDAHFGTTKKNQCTGRARVH